MSHGRVSLEEAVARVAASAAFREAPSCRHALLLLAKGVTASELEEALYGRSNRYASARRQLMARVRGRLEGFAREEGRRLPWRLDLPPSGLELRLTHRRRRSHVIAACAALAAMLAIGFVCAWAATGRRDVASVALSGNVLRGIDRTGTTAWTVPLRGPIATLAPGQLERLAMIEDLDDDGRSEVVVALPRGQGGPRDRVEAIDALGRPLWTTALTATLDGTGADGAQHVALACSMRGPRGWRGAARLLVLLNESSGGGSWAMFLDGNGRTVGRYRNVGHLQYAAWWDHDVDGFEELVLAGANNANDTAAIVILDPGRVSAGLLREVPDDGVLAQIEFAVDRALLVETRRPYALQPQSTGRDLVVNVSVDGAGLYYIVSPDLRVRVRQSDDFGRHLERLGLRTSGWNEHLARLVRTRTPDHVRR